MVELVQTGRTPGELSREFGVTSQSIAAWVAQAAVDNGKPLPGKDVLSTAEREELARLRRQVKRLEQERDILANRLHGAPLPCGIETLAPRLARRLDARPLAFWRLMTP
jgi:transposase